MFQQAEWKGTECGQRPEKAAPAWAGRSQRDLGGGGEGGSGKYPDVGSSGLRGALGRQPRRWPGLRPSCLPSQVRFSRPESEQARQRRAQSYEFLQKKHAEEPWVRLHYHGLRVSGQRPRAGGGSHPAQCPPRPWSPLPQGGHGCHPVLGAAPAPQPSEPLAEPGAGLLLAPLSSLPCGLDLRHTHRRPHGQGRV